MKILIAYGTKSGSTREMAEMLAEQLPSCEVTLCDLAVQQPDPADFDHVVIGTPIRMNRAQKSVARYVDRYEQVLSAMPHTLFLLCAFPDQFDHYLRVAYPRALIDTADDCLYFGGDLSISRQHGPARLLTRMLRNSILESEDEYVLPNLLPEHVRLLADRLRKK